MAEMLARTRYFSAERAMRCVALELYEAVAGLPLICPHGHVDPRLFAELDYTFGSPTELFLIPDHYIFRMLYSQGVPLEALAIPRRDGAVTEADHRKAWQLFADHFYLFGGTPTGIWFREALAQLFGVQEKLSSASAQALYDVIDEKLRAPEFQPRRLYERFNIEVLCTTDAATDSLAHHRAIRESSDWHGRILPTFRPDAVVNLETEGWRGQVRALGEASGIEVVDYASFIRALEERRAFFQAMGARATDHATLTAYTTSLSPQEADAILQRALKGRATGRDARRFAGHMMLEMARMSVEDGLVMQWHIGAYRNHNKLIWRRFGADMGADIPVAIHFTRHLRPLLNRFGNDARLRLILFNLDETTYSRELAPLAGHYPALKLGPPWWFFDSLNGMRRFFDRVMETAGIYNTVGFNDDTRAFPSIAVRHDMWRRSAADWVAGLVVRHIIDFSDALEMVHALAYGLAKSAYRLE